MNISGTDHRVINEIILEIRYRPNAKILDYRGTWAEMAAKHMDMTEWRIVENRFDIHDKDMSRRGFVSYKNAGFIMRNSTLIDFFPNQANKFLRFMFTQRPFGNQLMVERIGLRSRFATEFSGEFSELLARYVEHLLTLTPKAREIINAELIDIGGPLDFKTAHGNINTVSGPMGKNQLKEFFKFEENPPDVAFFFDADYWIRPEKEMQSKDILETVRFFAHEDWEIYDRLVNLVMGS